jgi:hypothetical protein
LLQDELPTADKIGELESQLAQAKNLLRAKERELQSAKSDRVAGAATLLIGLILLLFFGGIIETVGIFLIVVGVFAWITVTSNLSAQRMN